MNRVPAQLLILGCGASAGVPVIGCHCPVCTSHDLKNKRTRTSALLTVGQKKVLIDCGPDFRSQALAQKVETIDAMILTHSHNDHTAGIDDLKIFCVREKKSLPCLVSAETELEIVRRFDYIFNPKDDYRNLTPRLNLVTMPGNEGTIDFSGLVIHYFTYEQMHMGVNGFRFGDLSYVTDIRNYDQSIFRVLKGTENLVISALRFTPSHIHLTVDEAVEFAEKVGAKHTWLIHTSHDLDYEKTNAYLPENVRMAYDGLTIHFHAEVTDGIR